MAKPFLEEVGRLTDKAVVELYKPQMISGWNRSIDPDLFFSDFPELTEAERSHGWYKPFRLSSKLSKANLKPCQMMSLWRKNILPQIKAVQKGWYQRKESLHANPYCRFRWDAWSELPDTMLLGREKSIQHIEGLYLEKSNIIEESNGNGAFVSLLKVKVL